MTLLINVLSRSRNDKNSWRAGGSSGVRPGMTELTPPEMKSPWTITRIATASPIPLSQRTGIACGELCRQNANGRGKRGKMVGWKEGVELPVNFLFKRWLSYIEYGSGQKLEQYHTSRRTMVFDCAS